VLTAIIGCTKNNENTGINPNKRADTEENVDSDKTDDLEQGKQEDEELEEHSEGTEDRQRPDGGEPDQEEPADDIEEENLADDIKDESKQEEAKKDEPKKDVTEPRTKVNMDMWVKSNVNFRKEADTNSSIIKVLTHGTKVKALEKTANGWYYIESGGNRGYVSANYLSSTEIIQAKTETKKEEPKKEEPKKEEPKKEEPKEKEAKEEEPNKEKPKSDLNKKFPIPSGLPSGAKYIKALTGSDDTFAIHVYSYSKNLSEGSKVDEVHVTQYDSGKVEVLVWGYNKDGNQFAILNRSNSPQKLTYISGGSGGEKKNGKLDSTKEIEEVRGIISAFMKAYGK